MNSVFFCLFASLYLINFFKRSSISLSERLYFNLKLGDTTFMLINFSSFYNFLYFNFIIVYNKISIQIIAKKQLLRLKKLLKT